MKRKNLKNKIPYSALATMPLFSLPIILSLSAGSRYIDEPRYVKDLETRRSYTNKLNFETTFSANGLDRLFNGTTKIIETEGYTFFTNLFYPQDSWFNTAATKIRTRNSRAFPRITYNNGISGQNSIIKIANDTYSGTQIWKSENHRGTASYLNPEPYEVWKYNTNLDRIKEQAWFGADKNLYKGIYDAGREAGSRQALVDNGDFAKHSFNNLNLDISTESKLNNWINSMNISIENGNSSDFADQFRNSYFYNSKSLLDDNSSIRNALKEAIKRKYNEIKRSIASNFRITKFEVKNLEFKINFKFAEEGITGGALNFHYRLNNKIEKFKIAVNIDFAYETKNDSETITKQNLYNHLNNSKRLFLSSDFLENGVFEIPTDTGFERGLNTEKIAVDDTSNWEYAINKLNGYNFQSDSNFSSQLKMETYQDGEKLRFFIRYHNPFNNRTEHFLISENISVKYNPTDKFRNKDISSRLKITPGKYLDLTNPYSLELVDDKPVLIQESNKPVSRTYGGKWLYNAPAKLQFTTTIREDEVLFVNNQKVDVLDRNFQFNLADLRLEKTENNGQETSGTNEYEISVVKYNKTNANEENREEVSRYTIFIIIQSANNIVNGKWFAWDPENNPKQKELIEEFLVDKDNNFILDKNGNKINNPKFDPLIDKKTGTKKQIVWVEFKNSDLKLPNNTRFIQDPLNERNELLDNNEDITWGFIAEASVVGKGINLVLDDINNSNVAKRFLINKNNNEIIELINDELVQPTVNTGNDITLTSQENNYFSSSGIWLFTSRTEKGIDAYKMFLIGENSPKDLFTNTFPNESITPFWSSIKGKHLYSYLNQVLNIDNSQIFKLSYEEILNYWKLYINEAYVGKINN
ncbi:hypothetical protein NX772_01465 [Mesomycoplasma molare]|uniref:Uncharacterized protein n=2 Tax=Mesomycoplasma molare TaxID=171288 RepID=A0ABY5TY36_9BACT|nr:hypothetical protein [Mesomycoplasma molare]UWD34481.1 hypothetical protein NX772_01465 [Mesomycoplasma molare]